MKEAESKIRFIVILVFNCFEKAVEESIYIYMNDGFFSGLVFYSLSRGHGGINAKLVVGNTKKSSSDR